MTTPTNAQLYTMIQTLQAKDTTIEESIKGYLKVGDANSFYLMVCGVFVFFMQAGFALLEAGSVRAKNTKNILMKNLLDACLGAVIWWSWGYALAVRYLLACWLHALSPPHASRQPFRACYEHLLRIISPSPTASATTHPPPPHSQYDGPKNGETGYSGFIGNAAKQSDGLTGPSFFTMDYNNLQDDGAAYASWWFQFVFCAAAATIVSGAMAERTTLTGYIIYTFVISGFIYPVVVAWTWGGGWTNTFNQETEGQSSFVDFAGSGIVHMTGGIAALCGAAIVGPRKGRFDDNKAPIAIPAHNTTFQVLGTLILWVGWYGFNPGSTLGIAGYGLGMARCIVTTTLSAAMGGIITVVVDKMLISHTWDVGQLCNGILAGLVSITAGTGDVYPWAAMIIGLLGAFVYLGASKTVLYLCKVDDPLDAFAVHGACGAWGVIALGLFAKDNLSGGLCGSNKGLFYGKGYLLGNALLFIFANCAWTGTLSLAMFMPLRMAGLLRVSATVEDSGMDVSKHGGSAYYGTDGAPTMSTTAS